MFVTLADTTPVHLLPTSITGSKRSIIGVHFLGSRLVLIVFRLEDVVLLVLVEGSQGFSLEVQPVRRDVMTRRSGFGLPDGRLVVEQNGDLLDRPMAGFGETEPDEDQVKCLDDEVDAIAFHGVS